MRYKAVLASAIIAMGAISLSPSGAEAQTRAAGGETAARDRGTSSRPRESDIERQREKTDRWLREFDEKYGDIYGRNDFPSREVNAVPPAMANAAAARAEKRRAYADLNRVVRWEVDAFENADDMKQASAAQDKAYEAYMAARQRVLDELSQDDTYRAAVALRDEMGQDLANLHAMAPDEKDESNIMAVAEVKLTHASVARDLEVAALANDADVQESRERLVDATAHLLELRADFQRSLRGNADIQAARDAHEDARTARLAAEAYLEGTVDAAREAIDYSYYIHRHDRYRYLNYGNVYDPYDYYPYRGVRY